MFGQQRRSPRGAAPFQVMLRFQFLLFTGELVSHWGRQAALKRMETNTTSRWRCRLVDTGLLSSLSTHFHQKHNFSRPVRKTFPRD